MNICMLIEAWKPVWGGGQVHVWEIANKLVLNHKCKVDIFVMNLGNKKKESHHKKKLNIYKIGRKSNFNSFKDRLRWCIQVKKEIINKNKEKKYDIIHAHANLPGWPAKKLSKKLKIPVIYTIHGSGTNSIKDMYGNTLRSIILSKIENYLHTGIKYTKEITVDSSILKLKNKNKPIVIPNGVDIKKYDSISINKSKKLKVIFVGRLHPQKGLRYLLKSIFKIKDKIKNVEFHIVGGGEEDKFLKGLSSTLGLKDLVHFRGKIYGDDLIKEYKSSHLFVLPSLYEGQPLTLLEAWAGSLPVIVTNVGGNKDFIVEDKNGWMIESKDIKQLSETLLVAIKNKNLSSVGKEGYKLVKENYTWDKVAEMTYKVYMRLN